MNTPAPDLSSTKTVFRQAPHCISAPLEHETAILDSERGIYYGLNSVGTTIWNFLSESHTFDEIFQKVISEYEVAPEICHRDIMALLTALEANQLILLSEQA